MITTVCMNPAFDKTGTVSRLQIGHVNRLEDIRYDVGGKGINVAIVLKRLGVEVSCVGCLGMADQNTFLEMMARDALPFDFLPLPGNVRTNLKILDRESRLVTELNEPGPDMEPNQQKHFLSLLNKQAQGSDYVVFSGRLPGGCAMPFYQQCMQALPGQRCVLDAAGAALLCGLKAKPFLVKPNLPELEEATGRELRTLRAIRDAALTLIKQGARHVVVSMGKMGALFTDGTKAFFSPAIPVEVKSTVGAGDAMLGGILMGLSRGESPESSFRYGVAAGAASVMTEGTQLLKASDFKKLLPGVTLQEVS